MIYEKLLKGCFVITIIFAVGCHRRMFVSIPPKGAKIGCPFSTSRGCIPINHSDTSLVKERAFTGFFEIVNIELQKEVYKIEAKCDSLFKDGTQRWCEIFSRKTDKGKNRKKIKIGKKYELTLNPYFMHDILVDFAIREVYIGGIPVGIRTGRINIYTSSNLNGLYYIAPEKDSVAYGAIKKIDDTY